MSLDSQRRTPRKNDDAAFSMVDVVPVGEALARISLNNEEPLMQQVYVALRRLAVELVLLPNQFLSEKDVADGLAISKTPVREAFIRLAEDGVVRILPKSGTHIVPIEYGQAEEGFFVWSALEATCVQRLAEKHSFRDVDILRTQAAAEADAAAAGDAAGFRRENSQFHAALFDLAEFPVAKRLMESARFEVDRIRNILQMHCLAPMEEVVACHHAVVTAIAEGDGGRAAATMTAHLDGLRSVMRDCVERDDFRRYCAFLNQRRAGRRRVRSGGGSQR